MSTAYNQHYRPAFPALTVSLHKGLSLPGLYVVGDDSGSEIILGRDILNRLVLFLDGLSKQAEVIDEATANRLRARH